MRQGEVLGSPSGRARARLYADSKGAGAVDWSCRAAFGTWFLPHDSFESRRLRLVHRSRTPGPDPDATEGADGEYEPSRGLDPGSRVGRYEIQGVLGSGGMGVVVSARDPELDRPVAIKVLHRADLKSETWLKREAQALARLNHPNIVVVHDVGVVNGRPFIAMERIEGVTLAEWLDAKPRSVEQILTAFKAAGRGLSAAHRADIVHCDFKPANVMVCADLKMPLAEAVRVMDFGLAREAGRVAPSDAEPSTSNAALPSESALSDAFTELGRLRGTPRYMAPEQFALTEVGPAADQFAFCVSMYEALWGRSPFPGSTLAEQIAEQMCGVQPLAPPTGGRASALADAVTRGLQPSVEDRWPSMEALLDALAIPRRRRWWPVALGGVVAVGGAAWALTGGDAPCAQATSRLDGTWNKAERGAIDAAFENSGRSHAAKTWAMAEQRVDDWAGRWSAASRENCEATYVDETQTEKVFDTRSFCLTRQLQRFEAVIDALRSVEGEAVGRALDTVASLPEPDQCGDQAELLARPSDPKLREEIEASYAVLERCSVVGTTGDVRAELECTEAALATAVAIDDSNLLLDARARHGRALESNGRRAEARSFNEQSYFAAEAAGRVELSRQLAMRLAQEAARRDPEAARRWLRSAEASLKTVSHRSTYARIEALIFHYDRNEKRAIECAQASVRHAEESGVLGILGSALNTHGKILNDRGRTEEARPIYERAVAVQIEAWGEIHRSVATAVNNLGTALALSGDLEGSLTHFHRALAIRRALLPHAHRSIATATANVAETLSRLGRHAEAVPYLRESAEVFSAVEGPESDDHASLRIQMANELRKLERFEDARVSLDIALKIFRTHPLEHRGRFSAEAARALLLEAEGKPGLAIEFFESALDTKLRSADRASAVGHLKRLHAEAESKSP